MYKYLMLNILGSLLSWFPSGVPTHTTCMCGLFCTYDVRSYCIVLFVLLHICVVTYRLYRFASNAL